MENIIATLIPTHLVDKLAFIPFLFFRTNKKQILGY